MPDQEVRDLQERISQLEEWVVRHDYAGYVVIGGYLAICIIVIIILLEVYL